jgi:hypothetical protein
MPGVGYLLGGVIVSIGSPRTAYAVAGAGIVLLVVAVVVGRPGYVRREAAAATLTPRRRPGAPSGAA